MGSTASCMRISHGQATGHAVNRQVRLAPPSAVPRLAVHWRLSRATLGLLDDDGAFRLMCLVLVVRRNVTIRSIAVGGLSTPGDMLRSRAEGNERAVEVPLQGMPRVWNLRSGADGALNVDVQFETPQSSRAVELVAHVRRDIGAAVEEPLEDVRVAHPCSCSGCDGSSSNVISALLLGPATSPRHPFVLQAMLVCIPFGVPVLNVRVEYTGAGGTPRSVMHATCAEAALHAVSIMTGPGGRDPHSLSWRRWLAVPLEGVHVAQGGALRVRVALGDMVQHTHEPHHIIACALLRVRGPTYISQDSSQNVFYKQTH